MRMAGPLSNTDRIIKMSLRYKGFFDVVPFLFVLLTLSIKPVLYQSS
jgi:hypothetical protein